MRLRFLSSLTLLVPFAVEGQSASATPNGGADRRGLVARIDSLVADHLAKGPAASVSLAVVKGSDTIVMKGYGVADVSTKRPAGPSTVYRIGSITKQYTAAAILKLVEQGKVSLDDDLSKYVPSFPLQGHRVTIRQLLNHTSGIRSYTGSPVWRTRWADDLSPDSIVGFVARDTFDFAPGTRWRYNNTGYVLLGMVIEKASGKPYAKFLEDEYYRPLGLSQTSYCPSRTTDTTFAAGYRVENKAFAPAQYLSLTHPFSAGALCSTVRDYLVWQRALHGGDVMSKDSYALMTTPDTLPGGGRHNYGFGLSVGRVGPHSSIQHGGGIHGFTTMQVYVPAESLSVIAFTNTDAAGPDRMTMNIARAVLGIPLVTPPVIPPVVTLAATERDKVLGTYDLKRPDGGILPLRVFLQGETLVAQAEGPGQGVIPLLHYGNGVFGATFDPSLRLTFVQENGRVTSARLLQGGGTIEGARRP